MFHYFEAITNTSGESLIGYFARVIDPATLNVVPIYADENGTPIVTVSGVENMASTDDYGNLSFYLAPDTYHLDIYAPDTTTFRFRVPNVGMTSTQGEQGPPGPSGPANASFDTLAELKASDITNLSAILTANGSEGVFTWTPGDFTGQADDVNIIASDNEPLSIGAWVRQSSAGITVQQPSGTLRTVQDKVRETVSITDYGAVSGSNIVTAVNTALAALGDTDPATLVFPRGTWPIGSNVDWSAYRNVTFQFEAGATISNGTNTVILPERTAGQLGARFTGSGAVTSKNKDAVALVTPPSGWFPTGNDAIGLQAGNPTITGSNNLFWGDQAGSLASGVVVSNIGIGNRSLRKLTGGATGDPADGTPFPIASGNTCFGDSTGSEITTGYENALFGALAGQQLVTGKWNVAIGANALALNQNGDSNIAIGHYALVVWGGDNNLAIGWSAAENHSENSIFAIGFNACGGSVNSARCTGVGHWTLLNNVSGSDNTAVGSEALKNVVSGVNNAAFGSNALGAAGGASTNNTSIGTNSLIALTSGDNNIALGSGAGNVIVNFSGTISIGTGVSAEKSNQTVIGSTNTVETKVFGVYRNPTIYTVAGLPSPSAMGSGARTFVSDATATTFASVVVGGSTNVVPVYSDGTNWRIG